MDGRTLRLNRGVGSAHLWKLCCTRPTCGCRRRPSNYFHERCPVPYWPGTSLSMPIRVFRSSVTNTVCSKTYRLSPPLRPPSTPAHPLPTYAFSSTSSAACPARDGLSISLFLVPFLSHRSALSVPVPVPVLILPPLHTPFRSSHHGVLHTALTPGHEARRRSFLSF